ncbi:MAG TPA: M23 family metallopeptidase [Candidatus Cloacimonetes bacterium]|nr:M23 family metallopeptidase [Candidatus Cloacimonadota bacterium]
MKKLIFLLLLSVILSCTQKKEIIVEEIDPFVYKTGSLKSGETLAKALISKDIDNAVVYKMVNKLDSIYDLRKSHPADSFIVRLDSLDIVHELIYIPDKISSFHVIRDTSENYFTRIDSLPVTKTIEKCNGVILSSLYKSMIDEGENAALPVMFSQIFQWDIDFFVDPQKGDEFHLVYEKISAENEFIDYGDILVAQYKSKDYDNIAYRYKNKKGLTKYYNEKGESFQKAFLKSPLNYKRISSYFGKRYHPITKKYSMHNGVDYAAAYGTPVEAAADGTVIKASWNKRHTGETVKIRHANGYVTLYGHLSKYGKYKTGDRVKQHDVIGYVGSTGRSSGPHLHYTIYHHGVAIDPLKLKNVSGPPVPKAEMADFKVVVDSLKSLLNSERLYSLKEN